MTSWRVTFFFALVALAAASGCVGAGDDDLGGDGDADADGHVGGDDLPQPCLENTGELEDTEPNNTPAEASRGCTVGRTSEDNENDVRGVLELPGGPTGGSIGGDDVVDYFVFRTVGVGVDVQVTIWLRWNEGDEVMPLANLIDAVVYMANEGEEPVEVARSDSTGIECEYFRVSLPPGTRYLLELRVPEQDPMPEEQPYGMGF